MTAREWDKFVSYVELDKRIKIEGYVMLYPEAIKFIKNPSETLIEYAEKKRNLFMTTTGGRIDGSHLVFNCQFQGKTRIHRKYIQHLRIYKYNY